MDYKETKYNAFHDELEKMGGWPVIAAVASRALPAVMSMGSKLMKGGAGKKLMGAATVAPMLGGGRRAAAGAVKKPGFFSSIFKKRPTTYQGPRF
jgi:hypothetical protein